MIDAIENLGPEALSDVAAKLKSGRSDMRTRISAMSNLLRAGDDAAPHAKLIAKQLHDRNVTIRRRAVEIFLGLGCDALSPHTEALVTLLKDPDGYVRCTSMECLGQLADHGFLRPYVGQVAAQLQDVDADIRRVAVDLLLRVGHMTSVHIASLAALLTDTDADVRTQGVSALGQIGGPAQHYANLVAMKLRDPASTVRVAALIALPCFGHVAASYIADVQALERDRDFAVRRNVKACLVKLVRLEAYGHRRRAAEEAAELAKFPGEVPLVPDPWPEPSEGPEPWPPFDLVPDMESDQDPHPPVPVHPAASFLFEQE